MSKKNNIEKNKKKISLRVLVAYFWPHIKEYKWSASWSVLAFGVQTFVGGVMIPLVYRDLVDGISFVGQGSGVVPDVIISLLIKLGVLYLIVQFFYGSASYTSHYFFIGVRKLLEVFTLEKLLLHSRTFFVNRFSGSLVAKSARFVRAFQVLAGEILFNLWTIFVRFVGIFFVIFSIEPTIGWIFVGWTAMFLFVTWIIQRHKIPRDLAKAVMDSRLTARLSDVITNILNIKFFSGYARENHSYTRLTEEKRKVNMRSSNFNSFSSIIRQLLNVILELSVMIIVVIFWSKGVVTVGFVVLMQIYLMSISRRVQRISDGMLHVGEAMTDAQEMVDILEQTPDLLDPVKSEKINMENGAIELQNITFKYVDGQKVFQNFSLTIPAGQKVGLVGHSGSGKSTITNLLLRFVDVDKGAITVDGQDIRNVRQEELRKRISYVPQDPILFHRTLLENMRYGNPKATKKEVIAAAKRAHAHEFIKDFPEGYKTMVGERGVKLSGGQRQRVAIARVMLEDAPILILDEATSSLDSISEKLIQEAFQRAMKDRTTIVVAHRLSTIQNMDRILVLDKGKIVEEGTHAELLKKKGYYTRLWEAQKTM
ncbi:MAG: ATP-binding cassette subfamily B protein [Planctomycetota bacterium]|jgi:ATP-binding cassette subfamily B protein